MKNLDDRVTDAVRYFWQTRSNQGLRQGTRTGRRDYGNRTVATGGKQLDGFAELVAALLVEHGVPADAVLRTGRANLTLPGFFRPTKRWDLLVVIGDALLAAVEFKSLCGPSFGNNYNNRIEEAVGSSTDLWTAYREGVFQASPRPFLGYLLLLEEADASIRPTKPISVRTAKIAPPFRGASYADRCKESVRRLLRERCYDGACLLLSNKQDGMRGAYREPAGDLSFGKFASLLCNHVAAASKSLS